METNRTDYDDGSEYDDGGATGRSGGGETGRTDYGGETGRTDYGGAATGRSDVGGDTARTDYGAGTARSEMVTGRSDAGTARTEYDTNRGGVNDTTRTEFETARTDFNQTARTDRSDGMSPRDESEGYDDGQGEDGGEFEGEDWPMDYKAYQAPVFWKLPYRILFVCAEIAGVAYFVWRFIMTLNTGYWTYWYSLLLVLSELYFFLTTTLFFMNMWNPLARQISNLDELNPEFMMEAWPTVDVFIPCCREPVEVIRNTMMHSLKMDYPTDKLHVYILDDGKDSRVAEMVKECFSLNAPEIQDLKEFVEVDQDLTYLPADRIELLAPIKTARPMNNDAFKEGQLRSGILTARNYTRGKDDDGTGGPITSRGPMTQRGGDSTQRSGATTTRAGQSLGSKTTRGNTTKRGDQSQRTQRGNATKRGDQSQRGNTTQRGNVTQRGEVNFGAPSLVHRTRGMFTMRDNTPDAPVESAGNVTSRLAASQGMTTARLEQVRVNTARDVQHRLQDDGYDTTYDGERHGPPTSRLPATARAPITNRVPVTARLNDRRKESIDEGEQMGDAGGGNTTRSQRGERKRRPSVSDDEGGAGVTRRMGDDDSRGSYNSDEEMLDADAPVTVNRGGRNRNDSDPGTSSSDEKQGGMVPKLHLAKGEAPYPSHTQKAIFATGRATEGATGAQTKRKMLSMITQRAGNAEQEAFPMDAVGLPDDLPFDDLPALSYVARYKPPGLPHHAKAGNLNNALFNCGSTGELILILDCDMAPEPHMLKRLSPYFFYWNEDLEEYCWVDELSFVQSPQHFINLPFSDPFAHRNSLFYGPVIEGRDGQGGTPFVGTNAIFRRKALEDIGGICYGSVTEDMYTSMKLHSRGYTSAYHNEFLAHGLAPEDLPSTCKQRLRWSKGSLQILFRDFPLSHKGLNLWQRMFYFESSIYPFSGIFIILFSLTPPIFFFSGVSPTLIDSEYAFLLPIFFLPYFCLNRITIAVAATGINKDDIIRDGQLAWMLAPVWCVAVAEVLSGKKIDFTVTPKDGEVKKWSWLVFPAIFVFLTNTIGIIFAIIMFSVNKDYYQQVWVFYASLGFSISVIFLFYNTLKFSFFAPPTPDEDEKYVKKEFEFPWLFVIYTSAIVVFISTVTMWQIEQWGCNGKC